MCFFGALLVFSLGFVASYLTRICDWCQDGTTYR